MKQVIATQNERLDEIVLREYGTLSVFEKVLEANIDISSRVYLEMGDVINLPTIAKQEKQEEDSLW